MTTKSTSKSDANGWQQIRSDTGKLLMRLNSKKNMLELKRGSFFYYVEVDEYEESEAPDPENLDEVFPDPQAKCLKSKN